MVRMIKWRPASSRKFEARVLVKGLEGLGDWEEMGKLTAEIKWKGTKVMGLSKFRGVKRCLTSGGVFDDDGVLQWNEVFRNFCRFKENGIQCWEVVITVLNGLSQDSKSKAVVLGTASLNLGEYVASSLVGEIDINLPLTLSDRSVAYSPSLTISLSLIEAKCDPGIVEPAGISSASRKSASSPDKQREASPRNGRKNMNLFKGCVTAPKLEMVCLEDKESDSDMDSIVDFQGFDDEGEEETNMLQPLSYGPLTYVNFGHSISSYSVDVDDWVYYSNNKPLAESSPDENAATSVQDSSVRQSPKHRFLSWRKRKLGFGSTRPKGEPLLKKDCRDEGGDDIDFDRRQLTSSDESSFGWRQTEDGSTTSRSSFSEFEDEGFSVGVWEQKEITCRDGHMKLETQVFFASMDQRSERAAGESACTALVAVIAEWLQTNRCEMPIKSQFDRLIRDGSSEWRNLCENQACMERFPDKHFDLETVLESKIRNLSVVHDKSFIGFFHPEGIVEESCFDILRGSMSFDEIWDEISLQASDATTSSSPLIYIISWNDHFFILKVEEDAYYIIDTLGERLYEGCNQAYILKFDRDTKIKQIPTELDASGNGTRNKNLEDVRASDDKATLDEIQACDEGKESFVSSGKESCKEYIKRFLTAIPIRQLQSDIKKGLTSVPVHQRLQIEFHFTDMVLL